MLGVYKVIYMLTYLQKPAKSVQFRSQEKISPIILFNTKNSNIKKIFASLSHVVLLKET